MKKYVTVICFAIGILLVWCLFFGVPLIGYFDSVQRVGWVQTACGTDGCTTPVFIFDVVWMVGMFFGPLVLAFVGLYVWGIRVRK
ncbi:hypothetical protein [Listeria booriae]|uniref:hypothetical protein n=1 Tax=Listeria booriae TaxID=1552123 RepID=UPI0016284C5E|nr:hypothetical protein [Listeria booriae]MBC2304198.1 hypothetical protein [Listeria booriae]